MATDLPGRSGEEVLKLLARHLAGRHRELPMVVFAQPRNKTINRHIERRIGNGGGSEFTVHEMLEGVRVESTSTEQPVPPEMPEIARAIDGRGGHVDRQAVRSIGFLRVDLETFDPDVDLGEFKAGGFDVESEAEIDQSLEFAAKTTVIPTRFVMEAVVRQREGPQLRGREMGHADGGDLREPQLLRRFEPPVAGDDLILAVDHKRRDEAVGAHRPRQLPDLGGRVSSRVVRIWLERTNRRIGDLVADVGDTIERRLGIGRGRHMACPLN